MPMPMSCLRPLPRPLAPILRRTWRLHSPLVGHLVRLTSTTSPSPPPPSRLDPTADDYSLTPFADRCILTLEAGAGGHGCVSFLREKYIEEGPANGGDGGSGGNIYIQAVRGETSLHKLARRRLIKAGRGRNGQGKVKGGERGTDMVITVPIGTVVREIARHDPVGALIEAEEHAAVHGVAVEEDTATTTDTAEEPSSAFRRDRWLVHPSVVPTEVNRLKFPSLPPARRSHLASLEPPAPLYLDLDSHMETPMLLAAGAMGGLGNPHFMTPFNSRPKMATKGHEPLKISVQLELKLLADLALVGLPNAGKSTLLRALTNSRARIGNWAFTTLTPNVGTVVLDNHTGRPLVSAKLPDGSPRDSFTVADIPGLIEDAHLDKGLGLGFLRHVERAAVLAFVLDLGAGDAVESLKLLWREVGAYESLRARELAAETQRRVTYHPANQRPHTTQHDDILAAPSADPLPALPSEPITAKPWFVVATKADVAGTEENYAALVAYLDAVRQGTEAHPSGNRHAWKRGVTGVPVCAIKGEGVGGIPGLVMELLGQ